MHGFGHRLLDLLFPPRCLFCSGVIRRDRAACESCEPHLSRMEGSLCPVCGKGQRDCVCRAEPFGFVRCTAPFAYDGRVKNGILTLKREARSKAADYFGEAMARQVRLAYGDRAFDWVTYVPDAPDNTRGFNQARLLAEVVAVRLGINCTEPPILKLPGRMPQHNQSLAGRLDNAAQSYQKSGGSLPGVVLMVDDVMTTGSTLDRCARLLRESGSDAVYCVAAAATLRQNMFDDNNLT